MADPIYGGMVCNFFSRGQDSYDMVLFLVLYNMFYQTILDVGQKLEITEFAGVFVLTPSTYISYYLPVSV